MGTFKQHYLNYYLMVITGFISASYNLSLSAQVKATINSDLDNQHVMQLISSPLNCLNQEYPHHTPSSGSHELSANFSVSPSFYGCYDWHSSVHSHWTLLRALNRWDLSSTLSTKEKFNSCQPETVIWKNSSKNKLIQCQTRGQHTLTQHLQSLKSCQDKKQLLTDKLDKTQCLTKINRLQRERLISRRNCKKDPSAILKVNYKSSQDKPEKVVEYNCNNVESFWEQQISVRKKSCDKTTQHLKDQIYQTQITCETKARKIQSIQTSESVTCFDFESELKNNLDVKIHNCSSERKYDSVTQHIIRTLDNSFSTNNLSLEKSYIQRRGSRFFGHNYGMAWFLKLVAEVHILKDIHPKRATQWLNNLAQLESIFRQRARFYVDNLYDSSIPDPIPAPIADKNKKTEKDTPPPPPLPPINPNRIAMDTSGYHSNTAFSLSLILDYAHVTNDTSLIQAINKKSLELYGNYQQCPDETELMGEYSSWRILDPCFAQTELMSKILPTQRFLNWVSALMPVLLDKNLNSKNPYLVPKVPSIYDAHFTGFRLQRAWALRGISRLINPNNGRRHVLLQSSGKNFQQAINDIEENNQDYSLNHWINTFLTYYYTE